MGAGIWFGIAVICGIIWAWLTLSQKIKGDRHQQKAREFVQTGNWEQASLSYKLAIISRLDSETKLRELMQELSNLYKSQGFEVDLRRLNECPQILKDLGLGTGNQRKKNELILKLYSETQAFLDSLPGPKIP